MKMEVEVRVISTEIIKPSLPTPDHLCSHRLSFLDQISPPIFMPLVEFYGGSDGDTTTSRCDGLKRSLAEALTRFYPLAGRVRENHIVDCNDEGVPFVQARVHCQLSEVLADAQPGQLNRFLPYKLDDVRDLPAAVQVNFFDCGGIAIGLCISHKVCDQYSYSNLQEYPFFSFNKKSSNAMIWHSHVITVKHIYLTKEKSVPQEQVLVSPLVKGATSIGTDNGFNF